MTTVLDIDELRYIARVLEGLSMTYAESDDNSIRAAVAIKKTIDFRAGKALALGYLFRTGGDPWLFCGNESISEPEQSTLIYGESIGKLPLTTSGKAYIRKLKEDIDYIGTTIGVFVQVNLHTENGRIGFVSNMSGVSQYYSQS